MKSYTRLLMVALCLALASLASAQALSLPPYVCVGRILNYEMLNIAELTDTATISVYKADGTLLASANVANMEDSINNYRLLVPMATVSSSKAAVYGETLKATVSYAGKDYPSLESFTLNEAGLPGEANVHNLVLCTDADPKNGIADEYETVMQALWREASGDPNALYDPDADYDGDGISNRKEYEAGTDPLSAADKFEIIAFAPAPDKPEFLAITFIVSRAKSYQLRDTATLTADKAGWAVADFKHSPEEGTLHSTYHSGLSDPVTKTLYVPQTQATLYSRFFHITAE